MARELKLHAIVFAWPGQGHLNPVLRFAELLALQGCRVTFVHTHFNLNRVQQAAAAAAPAHHSQKEAAPELLRFVGIDDGLPPSYPRDLPSLMQATDARRHGYLTFAFEELVARLLSIDRAELNSASHTTTFIVSDFFMTFTQDCANKFHIPRIAIYLQSATSFACHILVSQGFRLLPEDQRGNWPHGALPSTTKPREMISFLQCYDPSDPIFDYMIRSFKHLSEPTWIVLNTFTELEHEVIDYLQKADTKIKHLQCGGPLMPQRFLTNDVDSSKYASESLWEEDHDCLKWLDSQALHSVLFVSFGSLVKFSSRQAEEFALGLENSMVPFLWVLRAGMIEDGGLPEGFEERVKKRACFVSWAPQVQVLAHESVGGFLTHCGWNSVIESIGMGVPLLGWGSFADQMLNARCIEDSWGVGLLLSDASDEVGKEEAGLITRRQVERKVRALMLELDSSIKSNCARYKEAASKALEDRNSLLIQSLINSIKQISPTTM